MSCLLRTVASPGSDPIQKPVSVQQRLITFLNMATKAKKTIMKKPSAAQPAVVQPVPAAPAQNRLMIAGSVAGHVYGTYVPQLPSHLNWIDDYPCLLAVTLPSHDILEVRCKARGYLL